MKRQTIRLIAILLTILLMLSACGKETEENRFINSDPGRGQSEIQTTTPEGTKTVTLDYSEYLAAKDASGFTEVEGWLPWEQFSALGEFQKTFWWDGQPHSVQYEYKYTNPDTGEEWIYRVSYDKLPEKAAIANMVEYQQWYYGREISEDFFERTCVRYTADHFDIADLTKQQESPDGTFAILDDILQMQFFDSNGDTNQLSGFISFVYNGYHVLIVKDKEVYTGIKETYDSSEDPEIIRRLTNTKTYMDAIKELMDPANANTKPE